TTRGMLRRFKVRVVCTTDDPADPLTYHAALAASSFETAVYPTFRPDAAMRLHDLATFNEWVDKLAATANVHVARLRDLLDAGRNRHDDFHLHGCRLSDHGLEQCPTVGCSDADAARIFDRARGGAVIDPDDADRFAGYLMIAFARLDAERGWTKQ